MPRTHISASNNRLRIALHNLSRRIHYIWALGWRGVRHKHHFQRWTGARNSLCWCGAVKKQPEPSRWVHVNSTLYGFTSKGGLVRKIDESDTDGLAQAGIRRISYAEEIG